MCSEAQSDELEVLRSIYDGDENFHEVSETVFQYKLGEDGTPKSLLLQIEWPKDYPESQVPLIVLDLFYNKHLLPKVKSELIEKLNSEAENNLGMAMTFTLVEYMKENFDTLLENQPDTFVVMEENNDLQESSDSDSERENKSKEKKVNLTKAQKRKLWDRGEGHEEKPRGYDWIDIVKHLSQTGGSQQK